MTYLFRSKPRLCLDISNQALKLLEFSFLKKNPFLSSLSYFPYQNQDELLSFLKANSLEKQKLFFALNDSLVITKRLSFSASLHKQQIEELIHLDSEKYLGLTADTIHFDFFIQGKNKENNNLLDVKVIAAKSLDILNIKSFAKEANLTLAAIRTEDFAFKKAVYFLLTHKAFSFSPLCLLIWLEKESMKLLLIEDKKIIQEKKEYFSLPFSLHSPTFLYERDFNFYINSIYQNISLILSNSLIPTQIWLSGNMKNLAELGECLQKEFSISTKVLNPIKSIPFSKPINYELVNRFGSSFLIALGLSLEG
ncbi:MAG: pilus assembly protein PilM [Proteobacteria bacterium]|nr:pilus assembly protein PilM [Pseudomonadota bacterium]